MSEQGDEIFMWRALELARNGAGKVSPGPLVGCTIVKDGIVIGEGFYEKDGAPHAECVALDDIDAVGATVYVTLEPCISFEGKRTGACADLLISKSVKRVVIGMEDPNVKVSGKGVARLKAAGIEVSVGMLKDECERVNEIYIVNMQRNMPFVALKMGVSLDGKIATESGDSKYITSDESRTKVHMLRAEYDAVLTTAQTVIADDPHLGVRHAEGSDPLRVIVERSSRAPEDAQVFRDENVRIVDGENLEKSLKSLYEDGICSVLVEAGSTFAASMIRQGLVDKIYFFSAPRIFGAKGLSAVGDLDIKLVDEAVELQRVKYEQIGRDMMVEGYLK